MPRRLGQHYLINKKAIRKIIEALELKRGDTILEIGPGHGELTGELRIKNDELRIVAIEKDKNLAEGLRFKIRDLGFKNFEIIEGDVLKILPSIIHNSKFIIRDYKIVGNIPYYITGKLLRIISELKQKPSLTVLTIQREVAERIIAGQGKMSLLAASVQFWAEPKIIARLKPKDFSPPPEVDSAVIKLTTYNLQLTTKEIANYYKLIKIAFKQPRKTLLNNLSKGLKTKKEKILLLLEKMGYNKNSRPQDLSIKDLIKLTAILW